MDTLGGLTVSTNDEPFDAEIITQSSASRARGLDSRIPALVPPSVFFGLPIASSPPLSIYPVSRTPYGRRRKGCSASLCEPGLRFGSLDMHTLCVRACVSE